jgi:hypothetical protein
MEKTMNTDKKLVLRTQSIRNLTAAELHAVHGGCKTTGPSCAATGGSGQVDEPVSLIPSWMRRRPA